MQLRRTTAIFTLICLAAACGGGTDDAQPDSSSSADTAATSQSPTSTTAVVSAPVGTNDATETIPPQTTSPETTTTVALDPSLPTIEELGDLAADGEISELELAVSEFAAIFDVDVDGAIEVALDPTRSADPSSVIELLDALRSELTETQREQIDDALLMPTADAIVITDEDLGDFDPAEPVTTGTTTPPTIDVDVEWNGLRSPTTVDPRLVSQLQAARTFVMGGLGGNTPRLNARFVTPESRSSSQARWLGWARTRALDDGSRICDITIVDFPPGTSGADAQFGTLIHEYFHCWHGQNFSASIEAYRRAPRWVKEGVAKWVEAQAVDTAQAMIWADDFLAPPAVSLYPRKYSAVGFFWQVGHWSGGDQAVWDRIPAIADQSNSPDAFDAAIAGMDREQYSVFGSSSAQFGEIGSSWEFSGPLGEPSGRTIRIVRVETAAGDSANAGGQTVTQFDYVATGEPQVITTTHDGPNVVHWLGDPESRSSLLSDGREAHWCLNGPCVCEDGDPPFDPMWTVPTTEASLLVGLTGLASDGARFKTVISDMEDVCNPPDDSELEGEWVADIDAIREAFNEAYSLIGINVTGVSGEMRMTLGADRAFTLSYDNIRLNLDDEFVGELVVDGSGTMEWDEDGGVVTILGRPEFNLTVETPALGGPPIVITADDIGPLEGKLTFDAVMDGSSLSVSNVDGSLAVVPPGQPNVIVFPKEWIRA